MKIWLKGGIVGEIVFIFLLTFSFLFGPENIFGLLLAYVAMPTYFLVFISEMWYFLIPLQIIYFFLLGAIIGLIFGKIKSRKNS